MEDTKDMVAMTDGVAGLVGDEPAERYSTLTAVFVVCQYSST